MSENTAQHIRWKPAVIIVAIGGVAFTVVKMIEVWPFEQVRSYVLIGITLGTLLALLIWWLGFSRAAMRVRLYAMVVALVPLGLFRHVGMSGDFIPIFEFRFGARGGGPVVAVPVEDVPRPDFPQLFGPARDCRLPGPALAEDWAKNPPQLIWRKPVGAAWSGFAIAGGRAVTMEQDGDHEAVTCSDVRTGSELWRMKYPSRYENSEGIAGFGPRATPTIAEGKVFTLGATGALCCTDLATGKLVWTRDIREGGAGVPQWGFASSPLLHGDKVIVSAGGIGKSLRAFRVKDGSPAWAEGDREANYGSPFLLTLAGREMIVLINSKLLTAPEPPVGAVTAHDPETGAVLWEQPWGTKMPAAALPVPVGANRVFVSSGYGVGSALFDVTASEGKFTVDRVWKTTRFQAKFSNPVELGGFVYGVSDGIFACLDLRDGAVKWKDGRYGHGQGLLIGAHYLQMTESPGELVLLRPMPDGPHELGRFRVFDDKTWNPVAITRELVLVRNDREAACVRLPLSLVAQ